MAQLQRMNACLDSLTNEMCQVNTRVKHIARQQACLDDYVPFPSPYLEALANEDDVASDDEDDNASSPYDDEMTTSQ